MTVACHLTRPTRTAIRKTDHVPSLFGLAPGGACHATSVARGAVRSYRTISTLPVFAPFGATPRQAGRPATPKLRSNVGGRCHFCGAVPGVAPGGCYPSPCPSWSPDFPPVLSDQQPSGHLTRRHYGRARSTAASACKVVVSNSGTVASSAFTRIGISVQPRMMPSTPFATSLAKTRRWVSREVSRNFP